MKLFRKSSRFLIEKNGELISLLFHFSEIVKFLIESKCQLNEVDQNGRTVLHRECLGHDNSEDPTEEKIFHLDVIKLLVCAGADLWKKDTDGMSPMEYAKKEHLETVLQFANSGLF